MAKGNYSPDLLGGKGEGNETISSYKRGKPVSEVVRRRLPDCQVWGRKAMRPNECAFSDWEMPT